MSQEREKFIPELENAPETLENKIERVAYEYKDKEGNPLGRAELLFGPENITSKYPTVGSSKPGICRELVGFRVIGPKGEEDVFDLANKEGVGVFMAAERLKSYYYENVIGYVTCPPLESSVGVGVLLHEFGHAEQKADERFAELYKFYGLSLDYVIKEKVDYKVIKLYIDKLIELVPEVKPFVDYKKMEKIKDLLADYSELSVGNELIGEKIAGHIKRKKNEIMNFVGGPLANSVGLMELSNSAGWDKAELKEISEKDERFEFEKAKKKELIDKMKGNGIVIVEIKAENGVNISLEDQLFTLEDLNNLIFVIAPSLVGKIKDVVPVQRGDNVFINFKFSEQIGGKKYTIDLNARLKKDDCRKYFIESKKIDEAMKSEKEEQEKLEVQMEKMKKRIMEVSVESGVEKIMSLSKLMCERDATYRAISWARKIRDKTGLDLFETIREKDRRLTAGQQGDCVASVTRVSESLGESFQDKDYMLDALKTALKTYGAHKFRIKSSKDKLGVMPVPGIRKKTKPSS